MISLYNIIEEALKDDLTPYEQEIVRKKWGEKYLNAESKKTDKLKDCKIKLSLDDKNLLLSTFFNFPVDRLANGLESFYKSIDEKFVEAFSNGLIDEKIDIQNLLLTNISLLLKPCLYNINVKLSTDTIQYSKNQKVNINKFIDSYNRLNGTIDGSIFKSKEISAANVE